MDKFRKNYRKRCDAYGGNIIKKPVIKQPTPLYTTLDHAREIAEFFCDSIKFRYVQGQKEHGGFLWKKPVLRELREEILDSCVYVYTLSHKIEEIKSKLVWVAQHVEDPEVLDTLYEAINDLENI